MANFSNFLKLVQDPIYTKDGMEFAMGMPLYRGSISHVRILQTDALKHEIMTFKTEGKNGTKLLHWLVPLGTKKPDDHLSLFRDNINNCPIYLAYGNMDAFIKEKIQNDIKTARYALSNLFSSAKTISESGKQKRLVYLKVCLDNLREYEQDIENESLQSQN